MVSRHVSPGLPILLVLVVILAGCAVEKGLLKTGSGGCDDETQPCNILQGFQGNTIATDAVGATIAGGGQRAFPNQVIGDFGTVSGGLDNLAGEHATVSGGSHNSAAGFRATIGGGSRNVASHEHATVGGGANNIASATRATIGGGSNNVASRVDATVAGGSGNTASFSHATVGGGTFNVASHLDSTVAGGSNNTAAGAYSTIGGGSNNTADGFNATVAGGSGNRAAGENAAIGGGLGNRIDDDYSVVGGGLGNVAGNANADGRDAQYATVGGGIDNNAGGRGSTVSGGGNNVAQGAYGVVPGGFSNSAAGDFSLAAGRRARVDPAHDGAFLYADAADFDFHSAAANEFAVRATGGVRFVTGLDEAGDPVAGVRLPEGSGSWESLSDRYAKINLTPVDSREILDRLLTIPIHRWSYSRQDPTIQHIGPMAQDFYAAFGLGEDDRYISMVDADGVALAAIQALSEITREQDERIRAQQEEIAVLKAGLIAQEGHVAALQQRVSELEQAAEQAAPAIRFPFPDWLLIGGGLLAAALVGRRFGRGR